MSFFGRTTSILFLFFLKSRENIETEGSVWGYWVVMVVVTVAAAATDLIHSTLFFVNREEHAYNNSMYVSGLRHTTFCFLFFSRTLRFSEHSLPDLLEY